MKIVVLDGHTVIQDDLNWEGLSRFGQLTVYDRSPYIEEETIKRIGDAGIVINSKVPITAKVMDQCPNLKYIGITATGYNIVDVKAAKERGIVVSNVPGYATETVAEFVFALLLHMMRQVALCNASVQQGEWCESKDFCYLPCSQETLFGKTLGIIGFGQIGRKTARIGQAFGMKILVSTGYPDPDLESENFRFVSQEELLKEADVVSLHCPLTEKTKYTIDEKALAIMKPSAYLVNTSRGPLIKETALAEALKEGKIRGAALDVLEKEPMEKDCPLLGLPNCVIAPHVAWATKECRQQLLDEIIHNAEAFMEGNPIHVVS